MPRRFPAPVVRRTYAPATSSAPGPSLTPEETFARQNRTLTPANALKLQRAAGNQAVQRLLAEQRAPTHTPAPPQAVPPPDGCPSGGFSPGPRGCISD